MFWRQMGHFLLANNSFTSGWDLWKALQAKYAGKTWFLLLDEMTNIVADTVVCSEFLDFICLLSSPQSDFFGGFLGAGTRLASELATTPVTATATPEEAQAADSGVSGPVLRQTLQRTLSTPSLLGGPSRWRSPFQSGMVIDVGLLTLEQTAQYLSNVGKAANISIDDEVKSDIHFFTYGNIGLVASCASILLNGVPYCRHVSMTEWERMKAFQARDYIAQCNRMIKRINDTYQRASNDSKELILTLLRSSEPHLTWGVEQKAASELLEMGIVRLLPGSAISLSSPFVRTFLMGLAYPTKHITPHVIPRRGDGSVDGIQLLNLAFQHVAADVISARQSSSRTGPAEAVIQAELYAVLRSFRTPTGAPGAFRTFVEVKHEPGREMRLDLMLAEINDNEHFVPIIGYEVKAQLLRRQQIWTVVKNQTDKYRIYHKIPQMYLVDFVHEDCELDVDVPVHAGEVGCLYVRYSSGFKNLRIQ